MGRYATYSAWALILGSILIFCSGCPETDYVRRPDSKARYAFTLVLKGGFDGQLLRLYIGKKKIYQDWPVTKGETGIADGVYYRTHTKKFSLRVEQPDMGRDNTVSINLNKGRAISLSIKDGKPTIAQQDVLEQD